ncbi:MAG: hypothetical protein K6F25_02415 [Bacteroidales bacterium]|nr:hypothetical protein [Bacteroidales bacterium]
MRLTELFPGLLAAVVLAISCGQEYTRVEPGPATPVTVESVGAEFDPHFYAQNVVGRPQTGIKAEDFGIIADRVTRMGLQKVRVMVQPQWYEPYNDNGDPFDTDMSAFRWNTVEMQSLLQVLELAQKNGMDVCLAIWGCTRSVKMVEDEYSDVTTCFMADREANHSWMCPPADYDEFGENFAALVKYLIEEKGLSCVNEVTPFNEPGGDIIDPAGYMGVCRALDAQFRRLGVREKVRFNLSDNIDTHQYYLEACADQLQGIADIFNSHTYIFGYETPNDTVLTWERNNVAISRHAGLKHIVGEFGSNQCVSSSRQKDIDGYLRGVLMVRHALNFFNAGACAVSYWSLIDQYYFYGADYEQMQQLGLWRSVKQEYAGDSTYTRIGSDYECRPQYYAYSLLSRHVRPGAEIHPIETGRDFAAATAFRNTDGKWVYVIANQHKEALDLAISSQARGRFDILTYREGCLPDDGSMIAPEGSVRTKGGVLKVHVPEESVVLCRQE